MCGILGLVYKENIPFLATMNLDDILPHRGPDDMGWMLYDGIEAITGKSLLPDRAARLFLLHRRLSILDLSASGQQPMICNNQRYYIIFNGEIYNYLELRDELSKEGAKFSSSSDSEVLLQAYIHWGKACLSKLIGMFAFAIFDKHHNILFFARDPFGIKPFYYYADENKLLFSSEIKSLLPLLPKRTLNSERVFFYLRSGMTDFSDKTLFSDINQLPAGHFFEINLTNYQMTQPSAYWTITTNVNNAISFNEAAHTLRNLFLKSLKFHLRSDVPVAATLSGGIDSSAIVMGARHLYPYIDIHTFSYIADSVHLSEEKWIDIINFNARAISHKVFINRENLAADIEGLIACQDEPFGSTSIYAQYRVFKATKEAGIKVVLDGQGADEMLGGYTFYIAARFASLLKQGKLKAAVELFLKTRPYLGNSMLVRASNYILPSAWQVLLRRIAGADYVPSWLNASWFVNNNAKLLPAKTAYSKHVLREELIHTLGYSSLPMLLRYEDRNSMNHSIESRVPFLTTEIVDFIFTLPEHFLIAPDGLSKAVFRQAMTNIVPKPILERRDKIGFATPEKNLLSILKLWVERTLTSDYAKQLPMFHHSELVKDWNNMLQGKSAFDNRFWRWVNFIKWAELYKIEV